MGAMLVGMLTSIPVIIITVFFVISNTVILTFCAYKNKMSVKWWLFSSLVLFFWVWIPFIFSIVKIRTAKCKSCGADVKRKTNFCPSCSERFEAFDDESFIRKIMIALAAAFAVFEIVNVVLVAVFGLG